ITEIRYNYDTVRKKFTSYERDDESGLDYAQARMYSNKLGRFTMVDPLMASADIINPQTFNRYAYVGNNPVNLTDPTGLKANCPEGQKCQADEDGNEYYINGDGQRIYVATTAVVVTVIIALVDTTATQTAKKATNGFGWFF